MSDKIEQQNFINHFVNAVYAILLGYGFSRSIREIYEPTKADDQLLFNSFTVNTFEYSLVLFAIIVLCVHWWDWRMHVGKHVNISNLTQTNIIEFTINILILLNLEWLFFEYDSLLNICLLMATLSILNFLWVLTFRLLRYNGKVSFKAYISRRIVLDHILKRFFGVILYVAFFIVFSIIYTPSESHDLKDWVILVFLLIVFIIDRIYLYSDRKILKAGRIQEI